jgi:DNA replication protein DnaC
LAGQHRRADAATKEWTKPDLLALDDLFLARRTAVVSAELLQYIAHHRHKLRRAIAITSYRAVPDWGKYLRDATDSGEAAAL